MLLPRPGGGGGGGAGRSSSLAGKAQARHGLDSRPRDVEVPKGVLPRRPDQGDCRAWGGGTVLAEGPNKKWNRQEWPAERLMKKHSRQTTIVRYSFRKKQKMAGWTFGANIHPLVVDGHYASIVRSDYHGQQARPSKFGLSTPICGTPPERRRRKEKKRISIRPCFREVSSDWTARPWESDVQGVPFVVVMAFRSISEKRRKTATGWRLPAEADGTSLEQRTPQDRAANW